MTVKLTSARVLSVAAVLSACFLAPSVATTQDLDDVYCSYWDGYDPGRETARTYVSAPFRGDWSRDHDTWETAFRDFLRANYALVERYRNAYCLPNAYPGKSFSDLEIAIRSARSPTREVIETGWASDSIPAAGDFETRPLRDFRLTVSRTDRAVNICIRDHECEDGDEVRVSVNGISVLREEIVNEWSCRSVPVTEGRNSIELYAINGSGRKGDCSYADANTGEIRIEGENIQTQSWQHRGGAGSSAAIIVTVQ